MKSGIQFWRLPGEESEFVSYLEKDGPILALPNRWVETVDALEPRPLREFLESENPTQFCFGLEEFARTSEVVPHDQDGKRWFSLDYLQPRLITYCRGNLILPGRLGYSTVGAQWQYINSGGILEEKEPEFRAWAEKVLRWVRKWTPYWQGHRKHRITKGVKAALDAGAIEIVETAWVGAEE